jgi:hemoglobin
MTTKPTLLEQLGGRDAIELVVADFYGRVLADSLLQPFFRGVQMSRQQNLQVDFLCHVLGGTEYRGRDMRTAHGHLPITDTHFDRVAGHLAASLKAAAVPPPLADQVLTLAASLRPQVVTAKTAQR